MNLRQKEKKNRLLNTENQLEVTGGEVGGEKGRGDEHYTWP